MKQKLRLFTSLLLLAVASAAWAQKITDKDDIVSGKQYYIGATTSNTDYYLSVDGSSVSTSIAGTAVQDKAHATVFTFAGGTDDKWTIQFESGLYLSLKSSKDNGKVVVSESPKVFTASNLSSDKIRLTIGSYSIQKNNSGTQFGSYGNTQTDLWLEEVSSTSAPSIKASDVTLEHNATSGSIGYVISNPVSGTKLTATKDENATWITNLIVGDEAVTFNTTANEGDVARSATITLSYPGASDKAVTVTQKPIDYAKLPFNWEGGTKADLEAQVGVTTNELGSDYADTHGAYRVKFDNDGDYIQVKTNERPGVVTMGVKMIGGANTSTVTVQSSSDGENFTKVEDLTISGKQNDILTLTTSEAFAADARYVRLLFTKGSNVGVGPITISKYGAVEAPTFSPLGGTFYREQSVSLSCATEGATIKYSFDNSNWETYSEAIRVSSTTTIYAKAVVGNLESAVVSATYTIEEKKDVVFNITDKELNYEDVYSITRGAGKDVVTDGFITVSTDNASVASVDGLKVTAVGVGTATITLSVSAGDTYKEGSTTFTVTVKAPEGQTTAPTSEGGIIFREGFTGSTGSITTFSNNDGGGTIQYDNDDVWFTTSAAGAGNAAKFGASKTAGSAEATGIIATIGKAYTLTFKAAPWASEETKMKVEATGATISGISEEAMTTGQWNDFTATITPTESPFSITFEADKNRFFLDEVVITDPNAGSSTFSVELNASGYATYCNQYPLDFTNNEDVTAWALTDIENNGDGTYKMKYAQITGAVKGGVGMLLKGEAFAEVEIESVDCETSPATNLFVGTLAPTFVEKDAVYGLSGDTFVKSKSAGNVKANKAYIPASELPADAKSFIFVFEDETTGIRTMETHSAEEVKAIFNIAGQRLQNMQKGINIVGGKKILVK